MKKCTTSARVKADKHAHFQKFLEELFGRPPSGAYLKPCRISTMVRFCQNSYFRKKASS